MPFRPEQMKVCAASFAVLPLFSIFVEIVDRARIGIAVVEVAHLLRYIKHWRGVFCHLAHGRCRIERSPGRPWSAGKWTLNICEKRGWSIFFRQILRNYLPTK